MKTTNIDGAKIIRSAEKAMLDFSELCGNLHLAAPGGSLPDNVALTGIFDDSKLYRMMYNGCDNGWTLDLKVKARVSRTDRDGRVQTHVLTIYRVADRLTDGDVAGKLLDIAREDLEFVCLNGTLVDLITQKSKMYYETDKNL